MVQETHMDNCAESTTKRMKGKLKKQFVYYQNHNPQKRRIYNKTVKQCPDKLKILPQRLHNICSCQ